MVCASLTLFQNLNRSQTPISTRLAAELAKFPSSFCCIKWSPRQSRLRIAPSPHPCSVWGVHELLDWWSSGVLMSWYNTAMRAWTLRLSQTRNTPPIAVSLQNQPTRSYKTSPLAAVAPVHVLLRLSLWRLFLCLSRGFLVCGHRSQVEVSLSKLVAKVWGSRLWEGWTSTDKSTGKASSAYPIV